MNWGIVLAGALMALGLDLPFWRLAAFLVGFSIFVSEVAK